MIQMQDLGLYSQAIVKVPIAANFKKFWKFNSSGHEWFIFKILLIATDWNFYELHHYLSINS